MHSKLFCNIMAYEEGSFMGKSVYKGEKKNLWGKSAAHIMLLDYLFQIYWNRYISLKGNTRHLL